MKVNKSSFLQNWFVLLYFIILFAERLQSIIRSCMDKNILLTGNGFNAYVYIITILSLTVFLVLLFVGNRYYFKALFTRDASIHEQINYLMLSITAGVILIGGMVHTEYTIPPVQFISYGMLIIAMIIKTADMNGTVSSSLLLWLSIIYLIAFSMAIPVMYHSDIPHAGIFHVTEAIVALLLVGVFTYFMYLVFIGKAVNLFMIFPIAAAIIGDTVILAMRWKEKVNGFVLIFLVVAVILWIIGKITASVKKI
ncbi:MAG: hypothetical protein ACI4EN_04705 [Butyrivibrio sp.]